MTSRRPCIVNTPLSPAPLGAAALFWALIALSPPAEAYRFDEETGRLSAEDVAFGAPFDSVLPGALTPVVTDEEGEPVGEAEVAARFVIDPDGLEGAGSFEMGGEVTTLQLFLEPLMAQLAGRRIEIRFWQRPLGTRLQARIYWALVDGVDPERSLLLSGFSFQPTGRATDDGWQEWTSGPVDFAAGGNWPPVLLELEDVQMAQERQLVGRDANMRVRLDALEILDLGPAQVAPHSCSRLDQAARCGPEGACVLGRCVDAALRYGPALQDPTLREDYLDRKLFEFRVFEGSRIAQALHFQLEEALRAARREDSAARFWAPLHRGISALRDGHASGPTPVYGVGHEVTNLGICIHLGEADLLPQPRPAPLVFSVEAENPVADRLAVGDVLAAIDGLPPYDWAVAVGLEASHAADPGAFEQLTAPRLLPSALLGGSILTFHRCSAQAGVIEPCPPDTVEVVEIDLGLLGEELWSGAMPEWIDDSQRCDYRFRRGVDDPDVRRYSFAGWADDGPVRTLIINGLPSSQWVGSAWNDAVQSAVDPPPAYLILDQRTGQGGDIGTTDFIMGLFLTEADFDRMEIVPYLEQTLDATTWGKLTSCRLIGDTNECGGFWSWPLHEMSDMDPDLRGVAATTRVAVLNAADVSGNDFTTRLFTHRSGPTRIFGASPTHGAFGPIASLPAHLDEFAGGSMQFWDTVFIVQPEDPPGSFATGIGVHPDQLVLQRQSDALAGVDTAIQAALAWLLEE